MHVALFFVVTALVEVGAGLLLLFLPAFPLALLLGGSPAGRRRCRVVTDGPLSIRRNQHETSETVGLGRGPGRRSGSGPDRRGWEGAGRTEWGEGHGPTGSRRREAGTGVHRCVRHGR